MNKQTYCQNSITVNLRPSLDSYLRAKAQREGKSMNSIINEALALYKTKEDGKHGWS